MAGGNCRYLLRFLLFYWICFILAAPLGSLTDDACKWVGDNILHVKVVIPLPGSGDTIRSHVGCLCAVVIAAVAALLWSVAVLLVQRWKPGWVPDAFLHGFVRVLVRFFLIDVLFVYSFIKFFPPRQFSELGSFRLNQRVGEMSPMGLLWTFMGFSAPYQVFTGSVEMLGGLLLIARRTTLLGAMVAMAAMTQVFMLNLCFDVPVKLYSLHYLFMAVFLVAPDLPRLVKVLVLGRAVEARPFKPLCGSVRIDRFALVFRALIVTAMLCIHSIGAHDRWSKAYGGPPVPVHGRWDVVSMLVDKKEPGKGDPMSWSWLDFFNKRSLRQSGPKPTTTVYKIRWIPEGKTFFLTKSGVTTWSATFTYDQPQPDRLQLQGSMEGKAIVVTLKPAPEERFELMDRGFHWIQELPYNQ